MVIRPSDPAVVRAAAQSLDELHRELGAILLGDGPGMAGRDPDEARRFGTEWLNRRTNELVKAICTSDLRALVRDGGADDIAEVATLLYATYPEATTVVLVAAIVCRRGLAVVCAAYDV